MRSHEVAQSLFCIKRHDDSETWHRCKEHFSCTEFILLLTTEKHWIAEKRLQRFTSEKVVRDIAQSRDKCLGGGPTEASRQRAVLSLPDGDTSVFATFFGLSGPKKCTTQEAFVAWLAC